ncbi:DUF397 domain-containing protein [Streptomyces sp. TRM68416]|uniref:DUF397 domain-containing protein n=1 Tax=Streptomyces sp. TRM68416 TaxID=2758412 RepID=UPI001661C615|nr:DUF397 domain-containing protein [Streptomyces sp. TRM68416]MBD0839094.1 DUF397 domain-containing protein [Streptomyces sp. TRM68416]
MIRKTAARDGSDLAWFKSSYSGGTQGDSCVEIAVAPRTIHVRDSKQDNGPQLTLAASSWAEFVFFASNI